METALSRNEMMDSINTFSSRIKNFGRLAALTFFFAATDSTFVALAGCAGTPLGWKGYLIHAFSFVFALVMVLAFSKSRILKSIFWYFYAKPCCPPPFSEYVEDPFMQYGSPFRKSLAGMLIGALCFFISAALVFLFAKLVVLANLNTIELDFFPLKTIIKRAVLIFPLACFVAYLGYAITLLPGFWGKGSGNSYGLKLSSKVLVYYLRFCLHLAVMCFCYSFYVSMFNVAIDTIKGLF